MKKAIFISMVITFALVWTLPAIAASTVSEVQTKKNQVESKISSVTKKKQEEQKKMNSAQKELDALKKEQAEEDKKKAELLQQLELINSEIADIDNAIKESEAKYDEQKELFKTRLKVMYENSRVSYIEILLQSKSISDFFARLAYVSRISKRDKEIIEQMEVAKEEVEQKKSLKLEEKRGIQEEASTRQQNIDSLSISRAGLEDTVHQSKKLLEQYEKQEDDLLAQSKSLASQIAKMQKSGTQYTGGSMKWPTPGKYSISSGYGYRIHPIYKVRKMHTGIDIDADKGDTIIAANSGKVIVSEYNRGGYGYMIIIDHGGGISTLYGHCSKLLVSEGTQVKAGQTIAKVGSTGTSTGPHLHFEVRKNGDPVDPMKYLKGK